MAVLPPPSLPAAGGCCRFFSCLRETGGRQRMMALPMQTWQARKPVPWHSVHVVAAAICRHGTAAQGAGSSLVDNQMMANHLKSKAACGSMHDQLCS